jgi:hypothetical protein
MKRASFLLVLAALVVGLVGVAARGEDPAPKPPEKKVSYGTMVRVDGATLVIKKGADEVKYETNENTKVMIEGQPSTLAALKPGKRVFVTTVDGVAVKVESTARPEK